MYHGLRHEVLYSVGHMRVLFANQSNETFEKTATCFSVKKESTLILVTNRHVFDPSYSPDGARYVGYKFWKALIQVFGADEQGLPTRSSIFYMDSDRNTPLWNGSCDTDVAIVYSPQVGNKDPDRADDKRFDYCVSFDELATEVELRQDLMPFDMVAFPSFPEWHDQKFGRAIIRGGTIACDPRFEYSHPSVRGEQNIVYEGFSFGGSSGSPIFALPKVAPIGFSGVERTFRRLFVAGVNAGSLNSAGQHSGLSYFVKSSEVRRLIEEAEALNSRGHS